MRPHTICLFLTFPAWRNALKVHSDYCKRLNVVPWLKNASLEEFSLEREKVIHLAVAR